MRCQRTGIFVVVVVGLLAILAGGQSAHANVLQNPGFELVQGQTPVGWEAHIAGKHADWERGVVQATAEAARTGNVGAKLSGEVSFVRQMVDVQGGRPYELSAWVRGDGPGAFKFEYINAAGRTFHEESKSFRGTPEWTEVSMSTEAPQDAIRVRVFLRLTGPGTLYYDDAVFAPTGEWAATDGVDVVDASLLDGWADPKAVSEVLDGTRTEANVAWWGFDPEDSTMFMQSAIDSGAPRVIIPNVGQDWIVRPINLRDNLELIFEDGVVVTAKKGEYHGRTDSLFNARDVENLIMRGYGATIRMHKEDYDNPDLYEKAEWRMGINLRGTRNVQILGLTIRDTGGDGIYLGRGSRIVHNENVVIRDIIADNNYRQGISVITAKDLLIEDSLFINTGGTAPAAGIDLEPNREDEILQNIVVRNSVFENNEGHGIHISIQNLTGKSEEVTLLWENLLIRGNRVGINFTMKNSDPPHGTVIIRNCIIEETEQNGIAIRNKEGDSLRVEIENCALINVARNPAVALSSSAPIYMGTQSNFGGVNFKDVVVADDRNRAVMYGFLNRPDERGFFDITGEIDVFNPYGAEAVWAGPADDVSVNIVERDRERPVLTVRYDEVIANRLYPTPPPRELRVTPAVRMQGLAATRPYTVVQRDLQPVIEFRHFEPGDVTNVEIYVNDELAFQTSHVEALQQFVIDTVQLDDDQHEIRVVVDGKAAGRLEEKAYFTTQNFRRIIDLLEGPKEVAWFGTVYNPISIDQSNGWEYVTDTPVDFFGDAHRKRRQGNTDEYIVWETADLVEFAFEVFAKQPAIDGILIVEGSGDQATWENIPYEVEDRGVSTAGWHKLIVRGSVPIDGGTHYTRLSLKQSPSPVEIQLGQADFKLLREINPNIEQ